MYRMKGEERRTMQVGRGGRKSRKREGIRNRKKEQQEARQNRRRKRRTNAEEG